MHRDRIRLAADCMIGAKSFSVSYGISLWRCGKMHAASPCRAACSRRGPPWPRSPFRSIRRRPCGYGHHLLAEHIGEPGCDDARHHVVRPSGAERYDDAHGTLGISLGDEVWAMAEPAAASKDGQKPRALFVAA